MRRFLSKTMIFLGVFSLILGTMTSLGTNISYAQDLEIIGEDIGLVIVPTNGKLFDLQNLSPGDTMSAKLTISNDYIYPFQLFMRTERISATPDVGEVDIFEQMLINIEFRGNTIYSGPMKDFAATNIDLGHFNPNNTEELIATVDLPGPETGNEFQGKSVDVKWVFTATADVPPEDPDDPDEPDDPDDPPEDPDDPEIDEEIIEEDIPEAIPEVEEEPVDEVEEEIIEEPVPEAIPSQALPKTGSASSFIVTGLGAVLLAAGLFIRKKDD